jgi:hypothetical protein
VKRQGVNTASPPVVDDVLNAIDVLFESGDVIEIRALAVGRTARHPGSTYSGYFNFENRHAIARAITQLDERAEGVYVVLNQLNPGLLARADNRLQAKPKHTTSDRDIIVQRWLYVDADPVRPAGISSTEEEHRASLQRAAEIRTFLDSLGWPAPLFCDSGNGGHLLYRVQQLDLERGGGLIKRCLRALGNRYSDAIVKVDEATANPARICKLYGTMTRKGDPMPDRPHRRSKILDAPKQLQAVPVEALEALAAEIQNAPPPKVAGRKEASGFDIDLWIEGSSLEIIKGPDTYNGGRRWTLSACLFNPEHEKPVIIELPTGALVYKCLHKSCSENNWKAFRAVIEMNQRTLGRSVLSSVGHPAAPQQGVSVITDLLQIPSVWRLESKLVWSVEEMIAQGSVTLICAESGTGKTWFGYYLAGCLAQGLPVIGLPSYRNKVLYVDGENPLYVVKQRLSDLAIQDTGDLIIWGGWIQDPPPNPSSRLVINFARQFKGLIIYDSLIEFHPGSEQSSTETRAFMRQFRALANMGATVVVLHHTGKAETAKLYRGSSDIKAVVDTAYLLRKDPGEPERLGKLSLTCFKARLMPGRNFAFEFRKGHGFVPCLSGSAKKRIEAIVAELLESSPGLNQTAIVSTVREQGFAKGEIEKCLKNGSFKQQPGPNNSILYSLREQVDREPRS